MNKILIADDNKQITSILAGYARKEGLEPVIALDGKEALDAFAKYGDEIVMILLDVMMPETALKFVAVCARSLWCLSLWLLPAVKIMIRLWALI